MISISKYILERVKQLGVKDVFGVPGDFNLNFLDHVEDDADLAWIGNTNELNGAYAADGYARAIGCALFVSTCGVGELSALNAFAGSYAEQIPVIHLVGVPSTRATSAGKIMHHTLGPGHSPDCFPNIWKNVTVRQVNVSADTRPAEIDEAIETCIRRNQPIYVSLPQDLINMPVPSEGLARPLNFEQPGNYMAVEAIVIDHIVGLLRSAKAPVLLFDAGAARDNILDECDGLIRALPSVPYFVSAMGKGSVSEHYANFAGCYAGSLSLTSVRAAFESADLVLFVGHIPTDMNTGMFSFDTTDQKVVELHADHTLVRGGKFERCGMKRMLPNLVAALEASARDDGPLTSAVEIPRDLALPSLEALPDGEGEGFLRYPFFWDRVQRFLREDDMLFAEPGTCGFGMTDLKLPLGASVSVQYLWASIGFGTAAVVGGAVAARSLEKRPSARSSAISSTSRTGRRRRALGFLGDGSFQMTFGELSTLVRLSAEDGEDGTEPPISATLFLVNNRGYTVEKYLHGVRRRYNDINSAWRYAETLRYFGADEGAAAGHIHSYTVRSEPEFERLLADPAFCAGRGVRLVEVHVRELDAGRLLTQVCKNAGRWDEAGRTPVDFDEVGRPYAD